MSILNSMGDKLNIPPESKSPMRGLVAILFRKCIKKRLTRGRSKENLITACFYIVCRISGFHRTLNEISRGNSVSKKEIATSSRFIMKELELRPPIFDSVRCVSKIAEKIGITGKIQGKAIEIICQAKEKRYGAGKNPMSLAAAALYIVCLLEDEQNGKEQRYRSFTQRDIARAAEITEVTIRNVYQELIEILDIKIMTKSEKNRSLFIHANSTTSLHPSGSVRVCEWVHANISPLTNL